MLHQDKLIPDWTSPCGTVQLYCADCRDILPHLGKVDAVVTDPPYGIDGSSGTIGLARAKAAYSGNWEDSLDAVRTIFAPVINTCIDMARSIVMTPGTKHAWEYPKPAAIGMIDQPASVGLCSWGATTCQPVLFYGKDPRLGKSIGRLTFKGDLRIPDVNHPCPKPLAVVEWMVQRASLEQETVFDPFMGSGTTGVAAIKLGRSFVGIEIERVYFEIAKERIMDALGMETVGKDGMKQRRMFAP